MSKGKSLTNRIGTAIILILIVLIFVQVRACSKLICHEDIIDQLASPNGSAQIVLQRQNCGAMSSFSGSYYIVDDVSSDPRLRRKSRFLVVEGQFPMVDWVSDTQIKVTLGLDTRVQSDREKVQGRTIIYGLN